MTQTKATPPLFEHSGGSYRRAIVAIVQTAVLLVVLVCFVVLAWLV